ncbi:MAG: alpha-ketoglutarate-dependent dioxygenase AlkB [Candidatus Brocadiae bacterium]|nr:alpha-ketoglutarate-dependent dioxygenase AlkB [Candidatus Brocadiia bacterium]
MRTPARRPDRPPGLHYDAGFVGPKDYADILAWLRTVHPLWELRFSDRRPPPGGQPQRSLLRPVYWLGNWQFACLDYYRPPEGLRDRCVAAEAFPAVLARLVRRIEDLTHRLFPPAIVPDGWRINTCLVNLYGDRIENGKRVDVARVGEHKDFEPGPVASISVGERALFQFVSSRKPGSRDAVELQQWLDDGSLLIFAGNHWKRRLFHRVQRVDRRAKATFEFPVEGFETRRVNFTFRYVPDEHVTPFSGLSAEAREDIRGYMETLARHSSWFRDQLQGETATPAEDGPVPASASRPRGTAAATGPPPDAAHRGGFPPRVPRGPAR